MLAFNGRVYLAVENAVETMNSIKGDECVVWDVIYTTPPYLSEKKHT